MGFNVSNALFIGPLGEFVDALAAKKKADGEKNAAVIDRGNDMLLHLLKKGGMVSVDMSGGPSHRDGLYWNKNILGFHGRFGFVGPSDLDESIVYLYQQGQKLSAEMGGLAKSNNERKEETNSLLLELVQKNCIG